VLYIIVIILYYERANKNQLFRPTLHAVGAYEVGDILDTMKYSQLAQPAHSAFSFCLAPFWSIKGMI